MNMFRLSIIMTCILLTSSIKAQDDQKTFKPTMDWSGFTHIWASYGERDTLNGYYGFALRYLRFKASGKLLENVKWSAQFGFDKGTPALVDVYLAYEPFEFLKLQFGQFPVPGAKSAVFPSSIWSTTKLMFNDRTTITQNWASNAGLKAFRSGGAMAYGSFLEKKLNYYLMAAMSHSGSDYYFNPSVKSADYENKENGTALYSRLEIIPIENVELGGNYHIGKGINQDTLSITRSSYSLYLLSRQEKLFLMAEYIGGKNTEVIHEIQDSQFRYSGYLFEIAYKLSGKYEPALRYDAYIPDLKNPDGNGINRYDNITVGFNYYPSKNIALMANYVIRLEDPEAGSDKLNNDLVYLQLRYKFASN